MHTRSCGLLLAPLLALTSRAQEAADPERNVALIQRLARLAEDAPATRTLAPHLAELLVHPDGSVRAAMLALVLCQPESFGDAQHALVKALSAPRLDDCAALAHAAAAPHFAVPIDEALKLLASTSSTDVQRGFRSLGRDIPALLPRLPEVLKQRNFDMGGPELLRKVHEQAPEAAIAAIVAVLPGLDHRGARLLNQMSEWDVRSTQYVDALVGLLTSQIPAAHELTRIARQDAATRARLADLTNGNDMAVATAALQVLANLGAAAADQWPKLAPCLRVGLLMPSAVPIARQVASERPEALAAVIANVPSADPYELAVIAGELTRWGDGAAAAVPVLAARLPHPDAQASLRSAQALFALGAGETLWQLLPSLLDHAAAPVQSRACILAAVSGTKAAEIRERLERHSRSADASVGSSALLALRLLDDATPMPSGELSDLVRDRDPWRTLATVAVLRRSPQATDLESEAMGRLLAPSAEGLDIWTTRQVLLDLDSGRIQPARLGRLLASGRSDAFLSLLLPRPDAVTLFRALIEHAQVLPFVHACLHGPAALPHRERLQELYPLLQQAADAVTDARTKLLLQAMGQGGKGRPTSTAALLEELAGGDAASRSRAARQLAQRSFDKDEIPQAQKLRRQGDAGQRRCIAAILESWTWTLEQKCTYAAAPEAFVAHRALYGLLHRPGPATALHPRAAEVLIASGRELLTSLSEEPHEAGSLIGAAAELGERGLPLLRVAMSMPALRPTALTHLAAAGPAAREFLPDVLSTLRTHSRESTGRALFAMGLQPGDADYQTAFRAVAALWQESLPYERAGLLSAVAALGPGATFAHEGVRQLLGSAHSSSFLQVPQLFRMMPSEPLHGWVQLALRGDQQVQQQIALLVLAGSDHRGVGHDELERLWQRATDSPALVAAVRRWAADAKEVDVDQMIALVLDSVSAGKPLPAAGEVLTLREARVTAVLPAHLQKRGWSRELANALARHAPSLLLDQLDGQAKEPRALLLAALPGLPAGKADLADRIDRSLRRSDQATRQALAAALVAQGPAALEYLRAHLEPEAALRATIVQAVTAAGSEAAFLLPELRAAFERDRANEQLLEIMRRLGGAGLTVVVDLATRPGKAVELLSRSAIDGDAATRTGALRLLQELEMAQALVAARACASHPSPDVRRWAGLIMMVDHGAEVDPQLLLPLFFDEAVVIRRRALESLGRAPQWPEPLGTAATDLLTDRDVSVRRAAAAAFAAHPEQCPPSRRALVEARAGETDRTVIADLDRALAHR